MHEVPKPLDLLIQEYLPAVEQELTQQVRLAGTNGSEELQKMLEYHMGWQGAGAGAAARGKRIRPLLVLLTASAAGGDWKRALPAASAVELVHNFSLIHDDIEDNSPLRRGRPTLWKLWGVPQAINAGDAIYALAHLEILRLEELTSTRTALQAVMLLHQTCLHLTQGQYLDLSYEQRKDLTLEDYWPMISGKTAALLAACTQLGALVAGLPIEQQMDYREFGRSLGLAFQIYDDILGIWGDAALTGKSVESDLITGKKSLPVLYGLSVKGSFARRWSQGPVAAQHIVEVTQLLENDGARDYAGKVADRLSAQALEALDHAHPQGLAGSALHQLTDQLLNRKK